MNAALHHAKLATRLRASWNDALGVHTRIERLASRIDAAWQTHGWREDAFPDVAGDELRAFLHEHELLSHELAHWMFSPYHVARSPAPSSSRPQVELYRDTRFRIEATFWFRDLTEIVDHDYAGVLALLEGQAVRSQWSFEPREWISDGVARGELLHTDTALLRPGAMRTIRPAEGYLEQTMYLEKTCVTLCIRTSTPRPAHCYRPPGLAFVRRDPSPTRARQLHLLGDMPVKSVPFAAETCAAQAIRGGTLLDAIEILDFMSAQRFDRPLLEEVYEQAKEVHGEALELVWRSLELARVRSLLAAIETGKDARHRLLLFLLLFMPDKAAMVSFLEREHPGKDASRLLRQWLLEARGAFGFERDTLSTFLLEGLLDELTEEELLERLGEEFDAQDVDDLRGDIRRVCHEILGQPLFQGLFSAVAWKPTVEQHAYECALDHDTLQYLPYPARFAALDPSFAKSLVLNPDHHLQEGDQLPPALEGRVPFAETLASRKPILWAQEPTTRHWLPYWLPAADRSLRSALLERPLDPTGFPDALLRQLYEAGIVISPRDADGRVTAWERALRGAQEAYASRGCAILPKLVNPLWVASLRKHYRKLHDAGEFEKEPESLGNIAIYLDGATRFLQHQLASTVSRIVGEEVLPSFCYTRIYGEHAKLYRHSDRPNCAWNVSIPYDLTPETEQPDSWPLFVETGGTPAEIRLEMGDGALFRGVSAEHWREPQPEGHRSTFGFAMFAPSTFRGTLY